MENKCIKGDPSLKNLHNLSPQKSALNAKAADAAINCCFSCGPHFG
jgi:hypothetical protein